MRRFLLCCLFVVFVTTFDLTCASLVFSVSDQHGVNHLVGTSTHCFPYSTKFLTRMAKIEPAANNSDDNICDQQHLDTIAVTSEFGHTKDNIPVGRLPDLTATSLTRETKRVGLNAMIKLCIYPSVMWGLLCCFPLRNPQPGLHFDNVLYVIWEIPASYLTAIIFPVWGGLFWETTWTNYAIGGLAFNFWIHGVTITSMSIEMFPFPLHIIAQASLGVPCFAIATYLQLDSTTKSTPKFLYNFVKFHATFLLLDSYFILSAYLMITSITRDDPVAQITALIVFSCVSYLSKQWSLKLTRLVVPTHQLDLRHDTVSQMRHDMFYVLELCNGLFVMLSFVNLSFESACVTLVFEVLPLLLRFFKLTPAYYKLAMKLHRPLVSDFRPEVFRLKEGKLFVIHLTAVFGSMACFFILGGVLRFGPNRNYFPLNRMCDEEMVPVIAYVAFNLACNTLVASAAQYVMKNRYGLDLFALGCHHTTEFFGSMLASSVTCYCFPVLLFVLHHKSLSLVDPDAYTRHEDSC